MLCDQLMFLFPLWFEIYDSLSWNDNKDDDQLEGFVDPPSGS